MKSTIITILLAVAALTVQAQTKVWDNIVMGYANAPIINVNRVALYADRTDVSLHIDYRKGRQMGFSRGTALKAGGKEYKVTGATVIKLDEPYTMPEDTLNLTLMFEPLPVTTQRFDFTSPDGLQLLNIRNANSLPEDITNTYWRNESTGDWMIGITPNHVIYKNKVWDIVSQTEKKDAYTLTINDGTIIKVGKMKKGQRIITIGKEKPAMCSPIVTAALPDYPTKDMRKGFVDNGYRTNDSVTIIGWMKDMPQQAWERGKEFCVGIENIFSDKEESSYAKMDSLGRFTLKMPILNSSQAFLDWGRTSKSTVLEPGKTYFLLYDFMAGQMLWMGDDVRVQNELLAHPHDWNEDRIGDKEEGKVTAMQFKVRTDASRAASMTKLQNCLTQHPNLSQRYIDYLTGYYLTDQGESMMQARYSIPGYDLPKEYMDYVGNELWKKACKPYTLYRDFSTFIRDYLNHLRDTQQGDWGILFRNTALRLEQQGVVTLTDKEREALNHYIVMHDQLEAGIKNDISQQERDSLINAFNSSETVTTLNALIVRMGKPLQDEMNLTGYRQTMEVLDSVGCDRALRDISLARQFCRAINESREPLPDVAVNMMEQEVQLPSAKAAVMALQNKYLEIQQRDITKSGILKSNNDVANMSDGEQILRKLTEPYRGRLVLLDIWGTWCGPCKAALSHSQEEYERLKDYNLVYLYLANRSPEDGWKNVIKEYNVTGENVVHYNLPADQQSAVEHFLQVHSFPTYKLIDRDGKVLDVNADPRNLESLAKLLDQMK
ncbi:Thiol-disulfide isomerase or thioredoxin [Prevotella communis]|uniref:Thiol-disulfide isomerase or thioredoxin n=1 Tax=Prevotella communis TaxID=2913614 RepID=A0A1H0FBK5_9BACT|nr:TlpA disulfide reductase family protein [Prevotella communis]SDN91839.1 Thiol-disulfide isomerase or thioredoxin [Prevotella communis]